MDFDNDGDPDLLGLQMMWGAARQLHAPWLARVGGAYDIEIHDRGAGTRVAAWWVGSALLQPPLVLPTLGRLHVNPGASIVGPTLGLSPGARVAGTTLPIPNVSSLIGGSFHLQALVVSGSGARWDLTNVVSDVFVR